MRAVDIIIKKREKQELTREELEYFIRGYTAGEIPDYQAAAWAMAVVLNGMNLRETTDLTLAMAFSGEVVDLTHVVPIAVDKHSTGGVGDKTTLVVEPAVAACGLPVGKMSGRGLGFTGGTLDKMESIPGFRSDLTTEEFIDQLRRIGLVLAGQTADLAPADGKLFDHLGVCFGMHGGGGLVQQTGKIGRTSHFIQLTCLFQFLVHRQKINWSAFFVQPDESFPDPAIADDVKILGNNDLRDFEIGIGIEQHGTQHGFLCFPAVGQSLGFHGRIICDWE